MRHFVPFLIGLLVLAVALRIDLFFTVVYFLAAIVILSRLWVSRVATRVSAVRSYQQRAFVGDDVHVNVTVRNSGALPVPWIRVSEMVPQGLADEPVVEEVMALGPHGKHGFDYHLYCRRRGVYLLGPTDAETGDLLGLAQRALEWPQRDELVVYPRVLPLTRGILPSLAAHASLRAATPLIEDPARIQGVRAYRGGDSPRRIHWPATARGGQLLVKQYEPAIARDTVIFLDSDAEGYEPEVRDSAFELAVVAAASLTNHIVEREHLPAGLVTGEQRVAPGSERARLLASLEALARIRLSDEDRFSATLRHERVNLSWGTTVVVITGRIRAEVAEALLSLRRAGFPVAVFLVQPRRAAVPFPVRVIQNERDIQLWS